MADKLPRDMDENELRYHCAALTDENERLRAALKPLADEDDMLGIHGNPPPPERMLMFASDGGGTFLGIDMGALYKAHDAYQQNARENAK